MSFYKSYYFLCKNICFIGVVLFTQSTFARWPSETWWFIFVKENFISENRSYTKKLFLAVKNNDAQAVLSALNEGAVIDARDNKGRTPLHWAVYMNHFEIAQLLLRKGADPNAVNRRHRTPLHWAVLKPDERWTRLLLFHHADPNIQDIRGRTALHWVALKPNENLDRSVLSQRTDASSKKEAKAPVFLPLYWDESDLKKIELLLLADADPNLKDMNQRTPLYGAVVYERFQVVQWLVKAGANVNHKDYMEDTPLHFLSKKKKLTSQALLIARFLLDHGADSNILNLAEASPTHLAEFHQHTPLYNLFLEFEGQPKRYNACMRVLRSLKGKIQRN